ncbi:DUF402 domain-containing protein [Mycoplasma sp. 2045]|uniref:DUF402 domain-containing protein n=1 Tax=unclassified Mycoplasma TaxID=2683645 RepID=UPI00211CEC91|nr:MULTISPECIES: DUF402 domain-containing protein [unclassified Mycoplasma]MEA4134453.1 DUF402 domain-containing protein [Mycoplasma sp. 2704]MEA4162681.1 DUF402 domain-containing protein [Mycoplasma sp. 4404]MEA4191040.1 DUF402 domain-containing protein [Mycoplasma sp. 2248]MEA4206261.1 DUF402 domain-containing protein [Mycoplasma sp. 1199]MEA4276328.1 DUF402 domain-containing protein [Mycoplasma sp. 21DD0573]
MLWDFSKLKVGQMINVQAYKHNGHLYRQWNSVKVIFHNKRHIVLFLKNTKVAEYERDVNGWRYKENAIWFIPKDSMYNAIVLLKESGSYYYINLASRPIFEDDTLKFIDYDLDIKCYPDKELQIVDREEFAEHSKEMKYPESLRKTIYDEIKDIISLYNDYEYFFSDEVIAYYLKVLYDDKLITEKTYNKLLDTNNRRKYNEETSMFADISKIYK